MAHVCKLGQKCREEHVGVDRVNHPRDCRCKKPGEMELMDRDLDILETVYRCKYLLTGQIQELFFGTKIAAYRRLRKLYDNGYLNVYMPELNRENFYLLTAKGARLLVDNEILVQEDVKKLPPRVLAKKEMSHLVMTNTVRIRLYKQAAEVGTEYSWISYWDIPEGVDLIPDAMFSLKVGGEPRDYALEVDLGTEGYKVIAKKLQKYNRYLSGGAPLYGVSSPILLMLFKSERRMHGVAQEMVSNPEFARNYGKKVFFGHFDTVMQHGILGASWARGGTLVHPYEIVAPEHCEKQAETLKFGG